MYSATVDPIHSDYKHQVAHQFNQATRTYNSYALVQKDCATALAALVRSHYSQLPSGAILEIGCGTGLVTQALVQLVSKHALDVTDLSLEMLEYCQRTLQLPRDQHHLATFPVTFKVMDGEAAIARPPGYAAIVSGFALQWFAQPIASLHRLIQCLQPGGMLLLSFPTDQSFPQWRQQCAQLGITMTGNALPNLSDICQALSNESVTYTVHEQTLDTTHDGAIAFFKSLKQIGAGFNRTQQALSPSQMRQLITHWNQQNPAPLHVHYHVAFLAIKRH